MLALWPIALWYVHRLTVGGGEPWGLLAAAAAVVLLMRRPATQPSGPVRLGLPTALLAAFVVAIALLAPLIAAAVGVLSLVSLLGEVRHGRRFDPAVCGLTLLALPDISTLQMFVGWPFRVGVAAVDVAFLRLAGIDAARDGTLLVLDGSAVAIDAPCSGVWMGWGALLVWLVLAGVERLGPRSTLLGVALLAPIVFLANAMRSLSLALAETRLDLPSWSHAGLGVIVFALVAGVVIVLAERLAARERRAACVAPLSI